MLTKIKIALAASLVVVTSSAATAQNVDPNFANCYCTPSYPNSAGTVARRTLRSAPVRLPQGNEWANRGPYNYNYIPQYNRRIPGNQGDTSYGQDWAQTWGGP